MIVRRLIEELSQLDPNLPVEIATRPEPDQWYEIADPASEAIELLPNVRGDIVCVINTD